MSGEQDLVGTVILGHYRIVRPIAWGGMGVIYLARNEGAAGFVRPVVVKRILDARSNDEQFVKMFVREARILAQLRHPGIVGILDFAHEQGGYFMVLEYVHGYSLRHWSRFVAQAHGPFPADVAVEVMASVAEALHYAHSLTDPYGQALNIVHRDVSPANVLVDVEGHVKLADFGIARTQLDRTDGAPALEVKGKIAYMAPELIRLGEPSAASDIYSCGVVLHELLVGRNEHYQGDVASTALHVLTHPLSPLHLARPELPGSLAALVAKATAPSPEGRFATALELAQALRAEKEALPSSGPLVDVTVRDFFDPRLSTLTGATELDDLARSWQADVPAQVHVQAPARDLSSGDASTIVPPPPKRSRARAAMLPGLVALLVAGAAIAIVMLRDPPARPSPQFVLIDGEASPYDEAADGGPAKAGREPPVSPPSETPAPPRTSDAGTAPSPPPGKVPAGGRPDGDGGDALGRAFASRRGQVARCIQQNASGIQGAPEITIRFRIGTDGRVTSADLSPPALQGTAVGTCVREVALGTRFPPQPAPVSFRIPVSFRQRR